MVLHPHETSNKVHLLHTCVEAISCADHISGIMEEQPVKHFKQNNQLKLKVLMKVMVSP